MTTLPTGPIPLLNQWNDFLLRELDPYAMAKYHLLLDWLGDVRGLTCLIVGSGSGELAALLALAGAKVLATDIDNNSIELTVQTAKRYGANLQTRVSRLEEFSDSEKFDLVLATDVIEHIADDQAAAKKLAHLTKKSGRLVITVPALQSLFGYHDEILHHYRRYNSSQLSRLFRPYLKIQKLQYFGFFLIPVALITSRILRRPYPVAYAGQAKKTKSLMGRLLRLIFKIEGNITFPLGTSLLLLGNVNSNNASDSAN
jgi:2-polyprenyl-3-methyl-5-hydroxy-6-metoxy-1,4-benzoquinol methylase